LVSHAGSALLAQVALAAFTAVAREQDADTSLRKAAIRGLGALPGKRASNSLEKLAELFSSREESPLKSAVRRELDKRHAR
jgi:hypothetical protein